MKLIKKNFTILPDNDITYFAHLTGIFDSADELSTVEICKNPHSYTFRVACSAPRYAQVLLGQLLDFHNLLGIHLNLSKSIKNNHTISFEITM
jgi:hypothetical protein